MTTRGAPFLRSKNGDFGLSYAEGIASRPLPANSTLFFSCSYPKPARILCPIAKYQYSRMDLNMYYIRAIIRCELSLPTPPVPPERPSPLFPRPLNRPYLLSFLSFAATLRACKSSTPFFPITCRLFRENNRGGGIPPATSLPTRTKNEKQYFRFFFHHPPLQPLHLHRTPVPLPGCRPLRTVPSSCRRAGGQWMGRR